MSFCLLKNVFVIGADHTEFNSSVRAGFVGKRILFYTYSINIFSYLCKKEFLHNSGDLVYFLAGYSYLFEKNDVHYLSCPIDEIIGRLNKDPNWAKDNFDIVVIMHANLYNKNCVSIMDSLSLFYKLVQIPIYCLGVGCQSSADYDDSFVKSIKGSIQKHNDALLENGGDITLRGDFTRHCMELCGYSGLFVSGCPSLYVRSPDNPIINEKVNESDFIPMISGRMVSDYSSLFKKYPKSCFFDQDLYMDILYAPEQIDPKDKRFNKTFFELYKNDRILGSLEYQTWVSQILDGKFNFSFGSRIHGNLIALQLNIPACVNVIDSRTREIAEFYKIPNVVSNPFEIEDIYSMYKSLDYGSFNENYEIKYREFSAYLDSKNIEHSLGTLNALQKKLQQLDGYDYRKDETVKKAKGSLVKRCSDLKLKADFYDIEQVIDYLDGKSFESVYLYGAGEQGKKYEYFLNKNNIPIKAFIDKNACSMNKKGENVTPVISLSEVNLSKKCCIVIASEFYKLEILGILKDHFAKLNKKYTVLSDNRGVVLNDEIPD